LSPRKNHFGCLFEKPLVEQDCAQQGRGKIKTGRAGSGLFDSGGGTAGSRLAQLSLGIAHACNKVLPSVHDLPFSEVVRV